MLELLIYVTLCVVAFIFGQISAFSEIEGHAYDDEPRGWEGTNNHD